MARPVLLAILGTTASGKSALGVALATAHDGEVVSCDSTAVYRGFDIGTDKVPAAERRGIPHHLVDVVEPTETYSAARYAIEAAAAVRAITERGRLPILVGGTGLYYRALVRGLFPGPGRDTALRERLRAVARRRGVEFLHRMVGRVDPASARRIQPRDETRLVRALEVFFLTRRPLTEHFADTRSLIPDYDVVAVGVQLSRDDLVKRIADRVDRQFRAGLLDEVRRLLAGGVPPDAPPFGALVYRQALEHIRGLHTEHATRELIVRENGRYARRQLIWFRKEPNLAWFSGAGESPETIEAVQAFLAARRLPSATPRA